MSQLSFEEDRSMTRIDMPGAYVRLMRGFLGQGEAHRAFESIKSSTRWRQDKITIYGKEYDVPRLQQWFGDPGMTYVYSRIEMKPEPWTPLLLDIKSKVEKECGCSFNSVLVNLYRDGKDKIGWHSDDEPELGDRPTIASVSLGADREFYFRSKAPEGPKASLVLSHGSLLVMSGDTQKNWQHCLPSRSNVDGPRINLTFRTLIKEP